MTINYPIILIRTPPAAAVEITAVDVPAVFDIVAFAGLMHHRCCCHCPLSFLYGHGLC